MCFGINTELRQFALVVSLSGTCIERSVNSTSEGGFCCFNLICVEIFPYFSAIYRYLITCRTRIVNRLSFGNASPQIFEIGSLRIEPSSAAAIVYLLCMSDKLGGILNRVCNTIRNLRVVVSGYSECIFCFSDRIFFICGCERTEASGSLLPVMFELIPSSFAPTNGSLRPHW